MFLECSLVSINASVVMWCKWFGHPAVKEPPPPSLACVVQSVALAEPVLFRHEMKI